MRITFGRATPARTGAVESSPVSATANTAIRGRIRFTEALGTWAARPGRAGRGRDARPGAGRGGARTRRGGAIPLFPGVKASKPPGGEKAVARRPDSFEPGRRA